MRPDDTKVTHDTRVRDAGPARKILAASEAWPAPHPLQPMVRRPRSWARATGYGSAATAGGGECETTCGFVVLTGVFRTEA
jgi:hypothetical protein